ncbi:hypothetical protein ACH5RR_008015 [Cinchona calisaya]|uniref:ABC-2 type transporter transmembrane domain-containing protein n=1 Tax=Cinchona calisaya TaxID=153742 RepID=A0ABD3AG91_9GENT
MRSISCLWKQWMSYWRSQEYNIQRFFFSLAAAFVVGTIFWRVGSKRDISENLLTIIGAMYTAVLFVGINNCSSVQPLIATERTVLCRERTAGMYSALPYAMAQKVPKWWIWDYWICPLAWTVCGLIASQYGDVEDTTEVPGMSDHSMIKDYIKQHFGYDSDICGL